MINVSRSPEVEDVAEDGFVDAMCLDPSPHLAHLAPIATVASEVDQVGDLHHPGEQSAVDRALAVTLSHL